MGILFAFIGILVGWFVGLIITVIINIKADKNIGNSICVVLAIIMFFVGGMFGNYLSSNPYYANRDQYEHTTSGVKCPYCGTGWRDKSFITNGRCKVCRKWD